MSDAPRTDRTADGIGARADRRGFVMPEDVNDLIDLNRTLERELSTALDEIERLKGGRDAAVKVLREVDRYFTKVRPSDDYGGERLSLSVVVSAEIAKYQGADANALDAAFQIGVNAAIDARKP